MSEKPSASKGKVGRRVIRGPWPATDPEPRGRWSGPLPLLLVGLAVLVGTQNLFPPRELLLQLTAGHRYLSGPVLARLLPPGSDLTFDFFLVGIDRVLAAGLLFLLLGWAARRCGLGRAHWLRGLPVSLAPLLVTLLLCLPLARLFSPGEPWWEGLTPPLVGALAVWSAGFGSELLLRGVLQAVLVAGLLRLMGADRRALAVLLGVVLAALWGALLLVAPLSSRDPGGWEMARQILHQGLILGMVLGAVFARTGNLVLVGSLHGSYDLLARLRLPGWPPTLVPSLFLLVTMVVAGALISRRLLGPGASGDGDEAG